MEDMLKKLLILFITLGAIVLLSNPALGKAKTTNDVLVQQDGDILFLTTTEATNSANTTKTTTQQSFISLEKSWITIPKGFATDVGTLLNAILSFVMLLGSLLVFTQLILAGLYWITSGGDKGKVDAARQRLMAAIIGLIILASSFAILTIGLNFLGFESLDEVFKNTKTIAP